MSVLPSLGFDSPVFADAQAINANIPIADVPQPAPRFVLQASAEDRTRALHCLSQAIYFEAGYEVPEGKRAVAQVVFLMAREYNAQDNAAAEATAGPQSRRARKVRRLHAHVSTPLLLTLMM